LQLTALGEADVLRFPWFEAPPEHLVQQARALLQRLGAVDAHGITELGRTLARLPVHPRLGRLLIEGRRLGHAERAALAAALLAERDPFRRPDIPVRPSANLPGGNVRSAPMPATTSDILDRVEALETFQRDGHYHGPLGALNRHAARFILRARDQLVRSLRQKKLPPAVPLSGGSPDEGLLRSLLAAFPDRVVRRREPGSRKGVIVGGRGVHLAPSSGVLQSELFLAIDVDAGQTEALVRQASAIQRDWLPPELLKSTIEVAFDPASEKVSARRKLRFEDLLIEESSAALPDDEESARTLPAAAELQLDRVLPALDTPAGSFRLRVQWLRQVMPELALPALDENDLRPFLPTLCRGCRSFDDLRRADWLGIFHSALTYAQRQALDREAPERLVVPSGSRLTLSYEVGRPPVLAVRIQEMFGLRDTPRLAAGRVKVLLHLLAPNHRPQQVTDDLASFWANTYPQVRKDLRARYPKHAWPEDPLSALPQRRPGRKPRD
jgi:ATP-dependent helicase HrpB